MRNDIEETDKFVATHTLGIDNPEFSMRTSNATDSVEQCTIFGVSFKKNLFFYFFHPCYSLCRVIYLKQKDC